MPDHQWVYVLFVPNMKLFCNSRKLFHPRPPQQEKLTQVPSDGEFQALAALKQTANARFIIGLPLEPNDYELAKAIMDKAKAYLGDAIVGFGLGNEPGARRRPRGEAAGGPRSGVGRAACSRG